MVYDTGVRAFWKPRHRPRSSPPRDPTAAIAPDAATNSPDDKLLPFGVRPRRPRWAFGGSLRNPESYEHAGPAAPPTTPRSSEFSSRARASRRSFADHPPSVL